MTTNILFVGVGGQGTLLASKILGYILTAQGYDFKASEVHGMSQRGGSVTVYVRFGEKIYSPVIEQGDADYVIAFEQLEALRNLVYLNPHGTVITDTQQIGIVQTNAEKYPEDCIALIKKTGADVIAVDAVNLADSCGSKKVANAVLLGVLAKKLDLEEKSFFQAMDLFVKKEYQEINKKAFLCGFHMQF